MRFRTLPLFLFAAAVLLTALPAAAKPNAHNTYDCLFCHREAPRFGVDTRETVTYRDVSPDDPALCLRCHKPEENLHPLGVKPGEPSATVASGKLPLGASAGLEGQVVCSTCHFVHAADADHALLRGFPGSQERGLFRSWQDLCRECHGANLEKRSPHAGDDRACAFCHQAKPKPGQEIAVAPKGKSLCNFCHGGLQDQHFEKANPFAADAACPTCHDPHLGEGHPGRLRASYIQAARENPTIDPHYRTALCFTCHKEEQGQPLLTADDVKLCNRCHASGQVVGDTHPLRPPSAGIKVPAGWPLTGGSLTCLTCHLAGHAADRESYKFLRGGPYGGRNEICFLCHNRDGFRSRNPHQDVSRMEGCEFCHAERPVPGKQNARTVKLVGDVAILCIRCHDENPHPAGVQHTVLLDAAKAAGIPGELPLDRSGKITCSTCHNPHLEENLNAKLRGGMSGMEMCTLCHRM